jgi:type VI protein secretion system component Hcp
MSLILWEVMTGENTSLLGESIVSGFENLLIVDSVKFDIAVENDVNHMGKRTIHLPKLSTLSIERKVDTATPMLTRYLLSAKVSGFPWILHFFRSLGGGPPNGGGRNQSFAGMMQVPFLSIVLHKAMVTSQALSFDAAMPTETLAVSAVSVQWNYGQFSTDNTRIGVTSYEFHVQAGTLV